MINIMLGTKGQYVKMAPVILELDRRGVDYRFIDAGQHPRIAAEIAKTFGLREPDIKLFNFTKDISKTQEALYWLVRNSAEILFKGLNGFVGPGSRNIDETLLLHGDAPPVLLSLLLGKRSRMNIAHVEAGERTGNWLQPFPEELIRIAADKLSDVLFAGSQRAISNLRREKIRGEVVDIGTNTILDSLRFVAGHYLATGNSEEGGYFLVSFHRYESLNSASRMRFLADLIKTIAGLKKTVLVMHDSTRHGFERYSLLSLLEQDERIEIRPLLPYHEFIRLLFHASMLVTDGGGPQQESHILGIPCLVLRNIVEQEGFENVYVSGFNKNEVSFFLENMHTFKIEGGIERFSGLEPSKKVVDHLVNHFL